MRVDFYQLSRDPVEAVLPLIAAKVLESGGRLLVVSADQAQRQRISERLWAVKDQFLAHGEAGAPHDDRQPILLGDTMAPNNGALNVALADGVWREPAEGTQRIFLMFGDATLDAARSLWRSLTKLEGYECHFWKQEQGKWIKAG